MYWEKDWPPTLAEMERLGGSVVCACVGGLCSPSTEVRLGACLSVLPWACAPLFCNIPGCLSVCLSVLVLLFQREASDWVPPPSFPAHEGPWLTIFIYTYKGDTVNFLTLLASGQRGFGNRHQSLRKLFCIWRRGCWKNCCRSVESRYHWQSPSILLGTEIQFAVMLASLVQRAKHRM